MKDKTGNMENPLNATTDVAMLSECTDSQLIDEIQKRGYVVVRMPPDERNWVDDDIGSGLE